MEFDALDHFFSWYVQNNPVKPPLGEIIKFDDRVTESILYRHGQFQVQMCTVAPGSELPDHIHPEVDSYELYISGDICFRRDGEPWYPQNPGKDTLRILPNSSHGGTFGDRGGVFLSIQYWQNGVDPDFISNHWEFSDPGETERNKDV